MKKKILTYYIILTALAVIITGFFTAEVARKYYREEVENKLRNSVILITNEVSEEFRLGRKPDYNQDAKKYAQLLASSQSSSSAPDKNASRVTIIDFKGNVLGESQTDYSEMENHLNRKEIQEAINGLIGEDRRISSTLKMEFIYVAAAVREANVIIRVSMPYVFLNNINQMIWFFTIMGMLTGIILTVLLAFRFSNSITRPINELINVSREIAKGNYSKRVKIYSGDELGHLADTFNTMTSTLEKTVAELTDKNARVDTIINSMTSGIVAVDTKYRVILINSILCDIFNIRSGPGTIGINLMELLRNHQVNKFLHDTIKNNATLVNDITISSPVERVLRVHTTPIKAVNSSESNSGGILLVQDITAIKKLEQIRTEFVSNVTHELKTPLTSIRGFIETLRSGAVNDREVTDKFLEIIDIEAERLYILINDILQLSEIENKQKDTDIGRHNLKGIIDETLSILEGVAEKKGIALESEADAGITILANRNRIKQMLINLIDNGIKYNHNGGSVRVHASKEEGRIRISVKDTGIGIPEESISRIFERFYRVDKGRSRSMGGTGLGLSIVKHIVNLYNGDIKVDSEPGHGTEFIIRLPEQN